MPKNRASVKSLIDWFNQLQEEKRAFILTCWENDWSVRLSNFLLSEDDINQYLELVDCVIDLINQYGEEERVLKKLTLSGLERKVAEYFYGFCEDFVQQKNDAKIVRMMSEQKFECLMSFVVEKMILSREYVYISPLYVAHTCGFQNATEVTKALRFLYSKVKAVANRRISPLTVKTLLEFDYRIPQNLIIIFMHYIENRLTELNQAQLLMQSDMMLRKYEQFKDILEKANEKRIEV